MRQGTRAARRLDEVDRVLQVASRGVQCGFVTRPQRQRIGGEAHGAIGEMPGKNVSQPVEPPAGDRAHADVTRCVGEITLGSHEDLVVVRHRRRVLPCRCRHAAEHQVRPRDRLPGDGLHVFIERGFHGGVAGEIDEHDLGLPVRRVDRQRLGEHVARRAGHVGDDGPRMTEQRVEERRLAGVGRTGQHDPGDGVELLAADGPVQYCTDVVARRQQPLYENAGCDCHNVLLIGEVDPRFHERQRSGDRVGKLTGQRAEPAAGEQTGGPQLRVAAGGDRRGDPLGLGQAHPAVEECPGRELAGLGAAGVDASNTARVQEYLDHPFQQRRVAGELDLRGVLARVRPRSREHQQQARDVEAANLEACRRDTAVARRAL